MEEKIVDFVNHPPHYADSCSIECIDAMELIFVGNELLPFLLATTFKYLWRWKNKGGNEDLDKATWYLDKYYQKSCGETTVPKRWDTIAKKLRKMVDNAILDNGKD